MKDTRSWKCLFGLHKWEIVDKKENMYYRNSESKKPYSIKIVIRSQCSYCGKFKSEFFD